MLQVNLFERIVTAIVGLVEISVGALMCLSGSFVGLILVITGIATIIGAELIPPPGRVA